MQSQIRIPQFAIRDSQSAIRNPQSGVPGLYIHIPFCKAKCGYCDFYSVTRTASLSGFIEALLQEMEMYRDRFHSFDTVYLGGGTPSVLSIEQLGVILTGVRKNFILLADSEITLEVNPGDPSIYYLESLRRIGINRLNIGIQSFNQKILDFLGRRHTSEQAVSAIEDSRKAGFDNIGLDLIYGIPGQDMESWMETLDQALAFSPEHLSCYQFTLEPTTPLGRGYERREFHLPGEELQFDLFMKTSERLENRGYIQYEVSNFARGKAYFSRHNQKYWSHTPYLGLGPAAHSFLRRERWWNHRSLDQYIADLKAGKPPIGESESLTQDQLRLEALFLGLRTKKGIHLQGYWDNYQCNLATEKNHILARLQEEGLLLLHDGYLSPTRAGLAVADRLALM